MKKVLKMMLKVFLGVCSVIYGLLIFLLMPVAAVIFIPVCAFINATWFELMGMAAILGWFCIRHPTILFYRNDHEKWEEQDGK